MNSPQLRPIILLAARAGFISRPIWDEFFATGAARWRRRCWRELRVSKVFLPHPSRFARDVIVPNRRHSFIREIVRSDISVAPFIAQVEHDEEVLRGVLRLQRGELLEAYWLEAEMKRHDLKSRTPSAIDRAKYPDVIVTLGGRGRSRRVALEMEMSLKSPQRYRQMIDAYSSRADVDTVIVVCRFKATVEYLRSAMKETYYPDEKRPIGFCNLEDWRSDPASAPIRFARKVETLSEMSGPP